MRDLRSTLDHSLPQISSAVVWADRWLHRSFFFVNYEAIRQSLGQSLIGFVPSALFRSRALATSPSLKPLIDAYPAGQTPIDANIDQISFQGSNRVREDSGLIRFDHQFTPKTSFSPATTLTTRSLTNRNGPLGSRRHLAIRPSNLAVRVIHTFSQRRQ
jgi:hypothetical protein